MTTFLFGTEPTVRWISTFQDPTKSVDCNAANPIVKTSFAIKEGNQSNFGGGNKGSIKLDFDARNRCDARAHLSQQ